MKPLLYSMFILMFASLQQTPWVAPASADAVKNPLTGNANPTAAGAKLFSVQ